MKHHEPRFLDDRDADLTFAELWKDSIRSNPGGLSIAQVADASGISDVSAYKYGDPERGTLRHVLLAVAKLARDGRDARLLHRTARDAGFELIERDMGQHGGAACLLAGIAKAMSETGDVARVVTDALLDDTIDDAEVLTIIREIDEAIRALQSLRVRVTGEHAAA